MAPTRSSKLGSLSVNLTNDGKQIIAALSEEIEKLKSEFNDMLQAKAKSSDEKLISEFAKLKKDFLEMAAENAREVKELKSQVNELQLKVLVLEDHIDNADAYERRDSIIISGNIPHETTGENSVQVARDVIKEKLRLDIATTDISTAHRLGKKPAASHLKRNLILKLCRRDLKKKI